MDLRLKSFCESVSALASKMATVYSLSLDLNLSKEITNNLLAAKSSLAQTNVLIQVLILRDSSGIKYVSFNLYWLNTIMFKAEGMQGGC